MIQVLYKDFWFGCKRFLLGVILFFGLGLPLIWLIEG